MFTAGSIIPIIIEMVCGAAGGMAVAHWARGLRLALPRSALSGIVGGLALTWLAGRTPGVSRFVGHVERAADATVQAVGGYTPEILVGIGIAGLLGGVLLTVIAGLVRTSASGS